jgi:hypothetical protein
MDDPKMALAPRRLRSSKKIRVVLGLVCVSVLLTYLFRGYPLPALAPLPRTALRDYPTPVLNVRPAAPALFPAPYNASLGFEKVMLISLPMYLVADSRNERLMIV